MSSGLAPDPGLQVERTGLAWVRSSMALAVVGLLLLRWLPVHGLVVALPSGVAFAMSAWLRLTARTHYRWGLGVPGPETEPGPEGEPPGRGHGALEVHVAAQPERVVMVLAGVLLLAAVGAWVML